MTSTILPTLKRWITALAETYFWLFALYLTMWFTMAFGKILVWLILLILGYRDGQGPVCGSPAWLLDIYFPEEEIVAGVRFGVFLFFVACWVGIL
ncbi:hypothetical protein K4K61_000689 [Colletotrichum sp. SAR11_59]|uniref:Uncharacterized protein n=1 Tax=Colletotrichum siamense TaxID=690259 RepID=A0A9P5BRJ0_COLSI|nr:hypothetical protein CGCSCA5_v001837 [Colletotrichum siamense]KAI8163672.1 hypothetical protein K4K50_012636 [Colletotrichum sp. SAR 10_71]KAI8176426.1 hypothetical protein KHU50_003978 [Colletotrichum sp. SAR 10_65]KAI8195701.1 hypothetical protein K4K49_007863 [Colletotrichum sp. SAR 10_70]KAI8203468.1 hypothetical protein K4K52_005449 [Colletotrichum sp. SAR 10_76]KAI8244380.1 hypothetical protein K4K53_003132 [Colletotrichum sp. SAR 10_77]KAI8269901.1 hypothetical protein K4K58_012800 